MRIRNSFAAAVAAAVAAVVFSAAFQPVEAAPVLIDDFNNNQTLQQVLSSGSPQAGLYWSYGNPLANGYTTGTLTAPSIAGVNRQNTVENPSSNTFGGITGGINSGSAVWNLSPSALDANAQTQTEWYFPTPISVAPGESIVVRGSGTYSQNGVDSPTYGYGLSTVVWNPTTGDNGGVFPSALQNNIDVGPSGSGALGDLVFSYDDLTNAGYATSNLNLMLLYFYAYGDGSNVSSISYTASRVEVVPEPAHMTLVAGLGAAVFGAWRMRKLRRSRMASGEATVG